MSGLVEKVLRNPKRRAAILHTLRKFPILKLWIVNVLSWGALVRFAGPVAGKHAHKPGRKTILLCVHEASRTGAPILGLNLAQELSKEANVVCLLVRGGPLLGDFKDACSELFYPRGGSISDIHPQALLHRVLMPVASRLGLDLVIGNSAETAVAISAAAAAGVQNIALIHEFPGYVPSSRLQAAVNDADIVVFSSELLARAVVEACKNEPAHQIISPQGRSSAPEIKSGPSSALTDFLVERRKVGSFLCIGCGYVQTRKGVDLFIAAAVRALDQGMNGHFLWVGDGFDPQDQRLGMWLQDQLTRGGHGSRIQIIPSVGADDLNQLYGAADALFLSSRLDPLPNVAIDALAAGVPVVCFEGVSGLPEYLREDPALLDLVVPFFDVSAAASVLSRLHNDPVWKRELADRCRRLAERRFDMPRYVAHMLSAIDAIGEQKGRLP